jgi:hypothetical protein
MMRRSFSASALILVLMFLAVAQSPINPGGPNVPETNPATTPPSPPFTPAAPVQPTPTPSPPPNSGISNPYIAPAPTAPGR